MECASCWNCNIIARVIAHLRDFAVYHHQYQNNNTREFWFYLRAGSLLSTPTAAKENRCQVDDACTVSLITATAADRGFPVNYGPCLLTTTRCSGIAWTVRDHRSPPLDDAARARACASLIICSQDHRKKVRFFQEDFLFPSFLRVVYCVLALSFFMPLIDSLKKASCSLFPSFPHFFLNYIRE